MSDSVSVPTGYGNVTRVGVNLTITNASREDTGVYMCSANNSVGNVNKSINITVQCKFTYVLYVIFCCDIMHVVQAEVISVSDVADSLENETNPVTFNCQAIGEPIPNISWYFNNNMINTSNTSKYNVSDLINGKVITSIFTIMNTKLTDVGNYTCVAKNIFGCDQSVGILVVNGKQACLIISF